MSFQPCLTTFGDLLRYLRERAELKQRELALRVGYCDTKISRRVYGSRYISWRKANGQPESSLAAHEIL